MGSQWVCQVQEAIHKRPQSGARDQDAGDVAAADAVSGFVTALPVDEAGACQGEDLQRGDRDGGAADREGEVGHRVEHRSGSFELRESYHAGGGVSAPRCNPPG